MTTQYINQQAIKHQAFIDAYGANVLNQQPNADGWINGLKCMYHNDTTPSAGYNVVTDVLHCFTCDDSWKMGLNSGLDIITKLTMVLDTIKLMATEEPDTEYNLYYNPGVIPNQILARGYSVKDFEPYGGGSDSEGNLVLPIRNMDGMVVGSVTRFLGQYGKRYLYSRGLRVNRYVYGADLLKTAQLDCLYVTEGSLNAIWLNKFGYPSVALLGSAISNRKIDLIKRISFNKLVVIVDNDPTGIKVFNKLKKRFKNFGVEIYYVLVPYGCSDIQDVRDPQLLHRLISNNILDG